ncbi:MAG: alpha/beta fold hydrolase [Candidatus Sumerlaeaceae bacterium]
MSASDTKTTTATEQQSSGTSGIPDLAPVPGNSNLLASQVPALDPELRERVMQYLNSRAANLLDVSPKGDNVLVATRFASTSQLHLVEQPMGARFQLTFNEEPISSARFLPGNTNIIFYVRDVGGGEFHQIYRFDRKSGRSVLLTDGKSRHSLPVLSQDGNLAAFTNNARNGRDTDVYIADIDENTTFSDVRLVTETTGTWAPLQFSRGRSRLLVEQYRAIDDADLHVFDVATSELLQITPKDGRGSVVDAAFGHDGNTVYLVTDRYTDFNELYEVHVGSTDAPKPLTRTLPWNVESIEVSHDGSRVAVSVNEDGISKIYLLDTKSGRLEPVELSPGIVGSMRFAAENSALLTFSIDSARSPTDVWQLEVASKKLTRWTRSEVGGLDTSSFVEPEIVRYESAGGVKVPSFVYQPKLAKGKRAPVLVLFHGGPEGQSRPNFSPFIQMLVTDLGIAVMMPNVRGSDGYGKAYLAMDNGVKREESLKDIGATFDWIAAQPNLDAERIGVYGGSYGGYMVLAAATFYAERVRSVVDVVGISNIPTFLKNTQDYRRDLRRAEYGDERVPDVREVQERISPLNHAEKIRAHLFVQQGKNDPRVPQSEAEQIVQAARKNGRSCWYLLGLNEGHGFARKENRDFALIATVQFLRETLLE